MDAIVEIDGIITIMDWKTSKAIYPEYFAQLSAYYYLLMNCDYGDTDLPKQVGILKLPKEDGCDFEYSTIKVDSEKFRNGWKYFEACLNLYNAKKLLK